MSMNLHCKEMDLRQTPTCITNMCVYVGVGKDGHGVQDKNWKAIRYRYIQWVKSHLNGVWEDPDDYEWVRKSIEEHIDELMSFKKLHFYVM